MDGIGSAPIAPPRRGGAAAAARSEEEVAEGEDDEDEDEDKGGDVEGLVGHCGRLGCWICRRGLEGEWKGYGGGGDGDRCWLVGWVGVGGRRRR